MGKSKRKQKLVLIIMIATLLGMYLVTSAWINTQKEEKKGNFIVEGIDFILTSDKLDANGKPLNTLKAPTKAFFDNNFNMVVQVITYTIENKSSYSIQAKLDTVIKYTTENATDKGVLIYHTLKENANKDPKTEIETYLKSVDSSLVIDPVYEKMKSYLLINNKQTIQEIKPQETKKGYLFIWCEYDKAKAYGLDSTSNYLANANIEIKVEAKQLNDPREWR